MSDDDIKMLLKMLRRGVKRSDWDEVNDAIEFIEDIFTEDDDEL